MKTITNKKIALKRISKNPLALEFVSKELKADLLTINRSISNQ